MFSLTSLTGSANTPCNRTSSSFRHNVFFPRKFTKLLRVFKYSLALSIKGISYFIIVTIVLTMLSIVLLMTSKGALAGSIAMDSVFLYFDH